MFQIVTQRCQEELEISLISKIPCCLLFLHFCFSFYGATSNFHQYAISLSFCFIWKNLILLVLHTFPIDLKEFLAKHLGSLVYCFEGSSCLPGMFLPSLSTRRTESNHNAMLCLLFSPCILEGWLILYY